jgi:preprotein translocase subunit SecG
MLFGLCASLFVIAALFMILLILMQKGKGGMGLGSMGGGNQMLFGSSGGQDLFQKATWVLGALLIFGSLGLAIWKTKQVGVSTAMLRSHSTPRPAAPMPLPDDSV